MDDEDRRCPQIDWVIGLALGHAHSKKGAARVLNHIRNSQPGQLCSDCHPLGLGFRLSLIMSEQEDRLWHQGFALIGGVEPGQEQAQPPPSSPEPPRSVRISPQAYPDDEALERQVRDTVFGDQQAIDHEVRRIRSLVGCFPKPIQDKVLMFVRWPPAAADLN